MCSFRYCTPSHCNTACLSSQPSPVCLSLPHLVSHFTTRPRIAACKGAACTVPCPAFARLHVFCSYAPGRHLTLRPQNRNRNRGVVRCGVRCLAPLGWIAFGQARVVNALALHRSPTCAPSFQVFAGFVEPREVGPPHVGHLHQHHCRPAGQCQQAPHQLLHCQNHVVVDQLVLYAVVEDVSVSCKQGECSFVVARQGDPDGSSSLSSVLSPYLRPFHSRRLFVHGITRNVMEFMESSREGAQKRITSLTPQTPGRRPGPRTAPGRRP